MTNPNLYRALVIAKALKLYDDTGYMVNKAYTPTAMLRNAARITGNNYKRGEYIKAHDDIMELIRDSHRGRR